MEIRVKLFATFREKGPKGLAIAEAFTLEIEENASVFDLLNKLDIPAVEAKIVLINGVAAKDYNDIIKENDLVACFPPIGGG